MARNSTSEDLPKAKLTKTSLQKATRLFGYLRPDRGKYFAGLIFLALTSATALAFPMLIGDLVNGANATQAAENINSRALLLIIILAAQAVFSFFRIYLFAQTTENTLVRLRQALYSHLISLPMSFFTQNRVGEINSRISADITQIQDTFTTTLAEFLRQLILIVGGLVFITVISPQLTLFMLALIPAIVIVGIFFGRYIRKISRQVQDTVAESNTIVQETMQGIVNVKAFANEFLELNRYRKSIKEIAVLSLKSAFSRGLFASFIILALFGAIVGIVWYATHLLQNGEITFGEVISFVIYTSFIGASIGGIAELYAQIQKAVGSTERIFEIMDQEPEEVELETKANSVNRIKGAVKFDHVHFSYPTRKELVVLNDINFEAKAGERIAIVGPSGAGKSTITQLLLRFYEPGSGQILIDGKPAQEYTLSELRNHMAIVPQDVLLFGGSIKENILYGNPDASEEEVIQAAKKANAHNFIEGFPEAYDTLVGERGITLSGGQRQRIAIARAVLKDPSILILDEATSSLDSESERLVQDALDQLMIGRTSFIVAHRLSTIRYADRILVIDRGVVSETGTHDELIAIHDGVYANLSRLQYDLREPLV
ncbi:MAG: ABC transporter transmembrane domain-containing protein [Bacteroidia bacterium]